MKALVTLILVFSSVSLFSESTAERLKRVKERTLIVELPLKDLDYINRLKGKGKQTEANDYEKRHKQVIENLKASFSKFWTYNEKVVFVPSDSVKAYINVYPQYYAVMRYGERAPFYMDKFKANYLAPFDGVRYMSLYLAEDSKQVLFCLLPYRSGLGEFIISMHEFNHATHVYLTHPNLEETYVNAYTTAREDKPRYETKDLTILIKREDIEDKNLNEEKVAKVYPYKYRIVEKKEWEDALLNQTQGLACYVVYIAPVTQTIHEDINGNGNRFDDMPSTRPGGFVVKAVCVAYDGHGEVATLGKDLAKELSEFKKQLDKHEKKAKQPKKD